MKVIRTVRGIPFSVEEKYTGPARNAIERVERMFDMNFGFGDLKNPTHEVIALMREATQQTVAIHREQHEQAEEAIATHRNLFFLIRCFTKKPKPYASVTETQVLEAYRAKFESFLRWLRDKNRNSRFYLNQLNGEIAACERLLEELK